MEEKLYQNIDEPLSNPLDTTTASLPQKKKIIEKKIYLLGAVIILSTLLLILALIISTLKKKTPSGQSSVEPTPFVTSPQGDNSLIPTQFKTRIEDLENSFSSPSNELPPPQIDTTIGL